MRQIRQILCLFMLVFIIAPISASEHTDDKKGLDLQGVLFGHIKDAYEWHITDIGDTPIAIPLPVIVKSSTGWHVFLSSKFEEGCQHFQSRPPA